MQRFAELFWTLDRLTATGDKRAALIAYFGQTPPRDLAWALWLLSGGKIGGAGRKLAGNGELRQWIGEASGLPDWLVDECYDQVGDLAETLALLAPGGGDGGSARGLADWIEQVLLPVANREEPVRRAVIQQAWRELDEPARLVFNKLLTGSLRVGVSRGLVQQALAQVAEVDIALIAQRMLGNWTPSEAFVAALLRPEPQAQDRAQPYPFYLASPLENGTDALGAVADWLLEWKWDGIRLQLIRREGVVALWSRGEERLDGRFPEIEAAAAALSADAVIDGELLAWDGDRPAPFTALQTRIQRRKPGPRTLAATPVRVMAYDLLELAGEDLRAQPLERRRARLAELLQGQDNPVLQLSPALQPASWEQASALHAQARERRVEGFMLKRHGSPYRVGRKRGDWWKWKIDPLSVDAVLLYAQAGHGRRSTLYTDYTFGLWDGERLVPVAKAYSGLDDAEILRLDQWIRAHTTERFGPVRAVEPRQVFELGFEAVNRSGRHKSGVAVRFPRILRWREDKPAAEADRLDTLLGLAQ